MSILLSNEGKSYAGAALVKMDKVRAFEDLREIVLGGQHPKVRRDAAYGLALYRSEDAINVLLTAYEEGRLPRNQVAYNVVQCGVTDSSLLRMLRSHDIRNQKLALAVIECLLAENLQLRLPGKEVAALVHELLKDPDVTMAWHRREKLSAWANPVNDVAT